MSIKQKLCELFGGLKKETANELEKICDDYATQYAEWCCARALGVNYFKLNEEELDQFKKEKDWNEAKHLEKIFDNYACDFAYWLSNDWLLDERWSKITEPKELLEIFKKEKGL